MIVYIFLTVLITLVAVLIFYKIYVDVRFVKSVVSAILISTFVYMYSVTETSVTSSDDEKIIYNS